MNKLMRKITAVFAALIMSVSVFGASALAVSAEYIQEDTLGWVMTERGWIYIMDDGKKAFGRLMKIDGVMYRFGNLPQEYEKYSGWTKSSDGTRRRYSKGLPYTGWLKYKSGQMRYCLDGYISTENMQIGDHIYTFDDNGYYTGKTALTLITKCDKLVSGDTDKINVAVKNLDGRDYNFGVLSSMERWEKGKWVNCWGDWKGENGEELAFISIGYFLGNKGDMMELELDPQLYTNYNFTEGYYRIPIGSWLGNYKNKYECYASFQVVPPVDVKTSESVYLDTGNGVKVEFTAEINSDTLENDDFDAHIFRMTSDGWKDITEHTYSDSEVSTEVVPIVEKQNGIVSYGMLVKDGVGYYKAVVNTKDNEYADYFRIEQLEVTPWLDGYSNKDEDMTVLFNVYNKLDRDIEMHTFAYDIYRMEDGRWVDPEKARIAYTDVEIGEPFKLESGEQVTIKMNVSANYDVSKLKAGEYAAYINGVGYGKFNIVNSRQDKAEYPFADLDASKIEKIKLTRYSWTKKHTFTTKNVKDILLWLSQVKIGEKLMNDVDVEGNIPVGVEIFYDDGTTKVIIFSYSTSVSYDGQRYECNPHVYNALYDFIDEKQEK